MEIQNEKSVISTVKIIIATTLTAFLITIILMGLLAVCICYTPLPEEAVTGAVYILNYVSVFTAGLLSAAKAKRKGFVTGGIAGACYMMLVYLLGVILFNGVHFTKDIALMVLYCTIVGMVGGIIGINLKK